VKGTLPIIAAARALQDQLLSPSLETPGEGPLDAARKAVTGMKKAALMVLGTAMQTYGDTLADEQEVLTSTADILIDAFAADSVVARARAATGGTAAIHAAAAAVFVNDASGRVELAARTALAAMAEGDTLRTLLAALRRFMKVAPVNTVALRRRIADQVLSSRGYPF
jgi:hypothetical protein